MNDHAKKVEMQCVRHYGPEILTRPPHHIEEPATTAPQVLAEPVKKPVFVEEFSGRPDLQPIPISDPRWK